MHDDAAFVHDDANNQLAEAFDYAIAAVVHLQFAVADEQQQ